MAATVGAHLNRIATTAVLSAVACVLIGVTTSVVFAASFRDQRESRRVAVYPNTPLPSILLPDDDLVVVERGGPLLAITIDEYVPARDEDFTNRARNAHVIVVAEFVRSNSTLAYNDTWIETDVTLVARQVIKDTEPASIGPDGTITFRHSGGQVQISDVQVRADHYLIFKPEERYLVFLSRRGREPNVFTGLMAAPFRITTDERLAPMMMSAGQPMTAPSALYGLDLKTVIAEITMRLRP